MADFTLDRRRFLAGFGATGAVALTYPGVTQALLTRSATAGVQDRFELLSNEQAKTLTALVDVVLPKTATPGGVEVGVPAFLDRQLLDCHSEAEQKAVVSLLTSLSEASFSILNGSDQHTLVTALSRGRKPFNAERQAQFEALKRLMVFGYFTSKPGATEVLTYDAIPGGYRGSIEYSAVGTTWGSLAYY